MVVHSPHVRRPPRFVVRVLAASFTTAVVVLAAVLAVILIHTRQIVERSVVGNLEAGQRLLAAVQRERQQDAAVQAMILGENAGLQRALARYRAQLSSAPDQYPDLGPITRELESLQTLLFADVVAVLDEERRVIAATGPRAGGWHDRTVELVMDEPTGFEAIATPAGRPFVVTVAPIAVPEAPAGLLVIGTCLDEAYATRLASLARTGISVAVNGRVVASSLEGEQRRAFEEAIAGGLGAAGSIKLEGERFAYRRIREVGPAAFYAVDSVTAAAREVSRAAFPTLVAIAAGGLVLCLLASVRLARTVSAPIDRLSRELAEMADAHETGPIPVPEHTSREIATLVGTFNRLVGSLTSARAETDAAVVGAIRALAAALDARDAYTAGHSERVSALSVAIGRQMHLSERDIEVLRLGALLHDIGKIGISDNILAKAGPLTEEEYEIIKIHPVLGAQILRTVPFLEPHLPIVELHHEQPDGLGYPYGLRGEQIPLLARIVHVADAFDAMTTARAYRAGRPAAEAIAVLWRHAGTQFDLEAVSGLSAALPEFLGSLLPLQDEPPAGEVVPFERRALEA
ncbi:MAG TPA: HD domain-containing phosphohydrolase [Vicinamibacterales bacterium]